LSDFWPGLVVICSTIILLDAIDFFVQSPSIGFRWLLARKWWVIFLTRGGIALVLAAFQYAVVPLRPETPTSRGAVAALLGLLGVLEGSKGQQMLGQASRVFGWNERSAGLISTFTSLIESIENVKAQIVEDEGRRKSEERKRFQGRWGVEISNRRSVDQIQGALASVLLEKFDPSDTTQSLPDMTVVVKELRDMAGADDNAFRLFLARRLVSEDSIQGRKLICRCISVGPFDLFLPFLRKR
jgi:hypothetical protein